MFAANICCLRSLQEKQVKEIGCFLPFTHFHFRFLIYFVVAKLILILLTLKLRHTITASVQFGKAVIENLPTKYEFNCHSRRRGVGHQRLRSQIHN